MTFPENVDDFYEVDLKKIKSFLLRNFKFILLFSSSSFLLGVLYVFITPPTYESTFELLINYEELSKEQIAPRLYTNLPHKAFILKKILKEKVPISISSNSMVKSIVASSDSIYLGKYLQNKIGSTKEQSQLEELDKFILSNYDRAGIINVSVKMSDSLIAFHVAKRLEYWLEKEIVDYVTLKKRKELAGLEKLLKKYEHHYKSNEDKRFAFYDQNRGELFGNTRENNSLLEVNSAHLNRSNGYIREQIQRIEVELENITPRLSVLEEPTIAIKAADRRNIFLIPFTCLIMGSFLGILIAFLRKKNNADNGLNIEK